MPWDGCELWVARIAADGSLHEARQVAGGPAESVLQPTWSPDGELYFVSDRNGWWNLYRERLGQVAPVFEIKAELGAPSWRFGSSNYAFVGADRLVCAYARNGEWRLGVVDASTGVLTTLDTPFTHFEYVTGHGDGGCGRSGLAHAGAGGGPHRRRRPPAVAERGPEERSRPGLLFTRARHRVPHFGRTHRPRVSSTRPATPCSGHPRMRGRR